MFPYTNSISATTTATTTTTKTTLEGPFFHFPSPFLDDIDDDGLLVMSHLLSQDPHNPPPDEIHKNLNMINGDGGVHKKRVKRDRHTKIRTAHGMRDRRMRLSVKVARKFFDLQDMLDFDKASKTIEWLLVNSESAIQELVGESNNNHFPVSSSASVSEVVSETNKEMEVKTITGNKPKDTRKRRRACHIYKLMPANPFARERRNRARARARERTREKMIAKKISKNRDSGHNIEFEGFGANNEARLGNVQVQNMIAKKTSKHQDSGYNHELEGFGANNEARLGNVQMQNMITKKTLKHQDLGHNHEFEGFGANNGARLGNNVQVQNMIPNSQEHSCTLQPYWNPNLVFGTIPNGQDQQNPNPNYSIFMNTNALELGMIPSPFFTPSNPNIGFHSHF